MFPSPKEKIETAKKLNGLLGKNALEVLSVLEEIGDLSEAKDSIELWDNLVKAAGSESKAEAMVAVLYPE